MPLLKHNSRPWLNSRQREIEARKCGHTDTPRLVVWGSTRVSGGVRVRPRSANTDIDILNLHTHGLVLRRKERRFITNIPRNMFLKSIKSDFGLQAYIEAKNWININKEIRKTTSQKEFLLKYLLKFLLF